MTAPATTRNKAAERLPNKDADFLRAYLDRGFLPQFEKALAAERRATVERIRERLAGMEGGAVLLTVPSFAAILDEEAAR